MATVGSMGSVVFNASSRRVFTIDNFKQNISINVASHDIIGQKPVLEMTGLASDEITFDILLRKQGNISPQKKLKELRSMCDTGKVFPFLLGGKPVSDNYWMLTNIGATTNYFGKGGEMISIGLSVTLKEYPVSQFKNDKSKSKLGQIQEKIGVVKDKVEEGKNRYLDVRDRFDDMTGGLF